MDIRDVNELLGVQQTWDDIVGSLIARRLDSVAGTLSYNYDENAIIMEPGGVATNAADRLIFNYQYPHACEVDGVMRLHMHYEQVSDDVLTFQIDYRVQVNGAAKTATWTTVTASSDTDNVYPYISGVLNQIIGLVEVDLTDAGLSATVQFRVTRTDVTADNINAIFVDAHVKRDMVGSRSEYVK